MTQKDVDLILEYQTCSVLHPFTCGNDSGHHTLLPYLNTKTCVITLICVNCDYVQEVDEELMAVVRMMLPGAREIEQALKAVSIMKEKLKDDE
mgnify:FL=1